MGQQIVYFLEHFKIQNYHGLNPSKSQFQQASQLLQKNKLSHFKLLNAASSHLSNLKQKYNKIISLDAAYHFDSREKFFQDSYNSLETGGSLTLTDMTFNGHNWLKNILANIIFPLGNIPRKNIISVEEYKKQLDTTGFKSIAITDISNLVFPGFSRFLKKFIEIYPKELCPKEKKRYRNTLYLAETLTRIFSINYVLVNCTK